MSVTLTLSNTEMSPRTSLLDVQIDRVFQETLVIQIIPRYSYHLSKCTTHTVNLAEGITQPADECMYGIRSDSSYDKKSDEGSNSVRKFWLFSGGRKMNFHHSFRLVRCTAFRLCITLWGQKWTVWPSETIFSQKMA